MLSALLFVDAVAGLGTIAAGRAMSNQLPIKPLYA